MRSIIIAALLSVACLSASSAEVDSSNILAVKSPIAAPIPEMAKESNPFKAGIIGGFHLPVGDLKEGSVGTQNNFGWAAGLTMSYDLNQNNQLRANMMYGSFPGQTKTSEVMPLGLSLGDTPLSITSDKKYSFENKSVGLDYLYSFDSNTHGAYVLGGLSVNNLKGTCKETLGVNGYNLLTKTSSVNETGLGYKIGVGYHFNEHASLEAVYNYMPVTESLFGIKNASSVGLNLVISF